ncbi:Het-C-domain-containing protein [Dentipellis sp. KUC8613]|nr:Het-C-domain-containing protein [Dentipellis sp. KUC8613]
MPSHLTICLILVVILVVCLPGHGVLAFGAGNIPSYAYMEGRAFRHGDIEDVLSEIAKKSGGFALGALIGKGGSKFSGLDVKRVYFGNWLRDYSQAVDITGLKKLPLQTIINLCMALGFLAHGYATNEFEVTQERLGVYLPTEHIDNPKGYGEGEDARKYDPRLRGPVDPRELEIDPHTGMKNYIANENGSWDTSKALVRRTLEKCIHHGRQHRAQGRKQDEYEAYRLLGQAMHTLEDFPAHSNFTELALVKLGHRDVFIHVGDNVRIQAPDGNYVAPLVTGTFGSSDFIHSLLGEATDHISEASVTDLNRAMTSAKTRSISSGPNPTDTLRDLLFKLPGGAGTEMSRDMEGIERIRNAPAQGGKPPDQLTPQELHSVLWQVLSFRDSVAKKIEKTIEKIPGLGPLIEKLMDSISVFVFTTLEPFLKPLLKTASTELMQASGQVINTHDQYEVFNDPRASDPTHSFLSKDHFNLILNEPAGNLARIIVKHSVTLVTKAWDDPSMNVHSVTEDILSCLFHPNFHNSSSGIQREMMGYVQSYVQGLGAKQHEILRRLSKNAVRNHENIRLAGEGGAPASQGSYAANAGVEAQHDIQGYLGNIPGFQQAQGLLGQFGGGQGGRRDAPGPTVPGGYEGSGHGGYPPPPPLGSRPPAAEPPRLGQAGDYYGEGAAPPPPNRPAVPPGPPPIPHGHGHHHHPHGGHPHGNAPVGFPDAAPGGAGYPGGPSGYSGQSSYPGQTSTYPGQSSYPGQSTYPGQSSYPGGPGGGFQMPEENPGYHPSYGGPPGYGPPPGGPPGAPPPGASSYNPNAGGFPTAQPDASAYPGQYGGGYRY